ncbi:MAG: nucleoside phosphorylase [Candidatus Riflebacteria bacterium]|nr:nucleoside phosphorylase [Candidatus Riflebacteria bacterium]
MTKTGSDFPILEFDDSEDALIEPSRFIRAGTPPEHCVICFFNEVVERIAREKQAKNFFNRNWESGKHKFYEIEHLGKRLAFFQPGVGAPMAAGLLEEAIAFGMRKFIACGGAGVLQSDIKLGKLVVVTSAVRDEGTSYHYQRPSREIDAQEGTVKVIEQTLLKNSIPYIKGKTWTTDAAYRETREKIQLRRTEGCITVDMEASAFIAVANFRKVKFGQILYSGDDLSGEEWDERNWGKQKQVRENLFWLAAETCLNL